MLKSTYTRLIYFIASWRLEHKEALLLLFTPLLRVNHSFVPMNDLIFRKMSKNWIRPPNSWKNCSRFRFIQNTSSSRDWSSAARGLCPQHLHCVASFIDDNATFANDVFRPVQITARVFAGWRTIALPKYRQGHFYLNLFIRDGKKSVMRWNKRRPATHVRPRPDLWCNI